jgi:exonuclease 1
MHRIKMLRHYGVEPYVVLDGDYLPSKLHTEDSRSAKRAENLSAGMRLHAQKQNAKATEHFQKCIDITPEIAHRFILALRRENVSYVVAPYEADAQLAYLEKQGIIEAIVTEDSDLLVFGCKTLLLKMDQFGECVEIKREKFANVSGTINLHGWTDEDFRHMAILSGCDYLASVNGVGLITAYRLLRKFNKNIQRVCPFGLVDKVIQSLRMQVGTRVPQDYMDSFRRANLTFKHQRVFCPAKECLVMWNEPDEPLPDELLVYIGAYVSLTH